MSHPPPPKKLVRGGEGGGGGAIFGHPRGRAGVGMWQRNLKLWGSLALVT